VNIERLRQSLKAKWLGYYQDNRQWLARLKIWSNGEGGSRPSSSFILATLAVLEPRLTELFPFIVELNNDPDRIVAALGLNFNPDRELQSLAKAETPAADPASRLLPSGNREIRFSQTNRLSHISND